MRRLPTLVCSVLVATGALVGIAAQRAAPAGAAVPPGFSDDLVASVPSPTALAFTPDGRMLITTQGGTVRVVQGGTLLAPPALDVSARLCSNSERGLLGIAVDPLFATNRYVFIYYTLNKGGDCGTTTVNRVSRFVMTGNSLGGEVVLVDNIPSPAGNHNGGDVQFGKDGLMYVSVGDGGCDYPGGTPSGCGGGNDAARDRHSLVGKILRITRDGGIPGGNPFTGPGTARCNVTGGTSVGQICQETFAWGLRNPFRMAFDPNASGTRFYVNDVGQSSWEEIDLGGAGADYGWNVREGNCATGSLTNCGPPPAGMTNPVFSYGRADGCGSITGGAFVPNSVWPAAFQGKYLFADFLCGRIFRLDPNGSGGFNRVDVATGLPGGGPVHLGFGPWNGTQALYYTTYAAGGQVRRISSPGGGAVAQSPYTVWAQPAATPLDGVGAWVAPANAPSAGTGQLSPAYLYGHYFGFANDPALGAVGLMTDPAGTFAVFTVMEANGTPHSAAVPFNWTANRFYFPLVYQLGPGVWGAWVYDNTAATWTPIGSLNLPAAWGKLSSATFTIAYWYGPVAAQCSQFPLADVLFAPPIGFLGTGSTIATATTTAATAGTCAPQTSVEAGGWHRYRVGAPSLA
jgi:glucose/arabinose dehydrogenase